MSHQSIHPGQIWPGKALTPEWLEIHWDLEFRHHSSGLGLASLVFSESDWIDGEWNAREALFLNNRWQRAPYWFRHWFLPQNRINYHLLLSFQKLLQSWQQWIHLPQVKTLSDFPPVAECAFLLMSAHSQFEQAQAKSDSLFKKGKLVHHMSMRQRRLYQYLAGIFRDLAPLVLAAPALEGYNQEAGLKEDISWHTKELSARVGGLEQKPELPERVRLQRMEVNRLLGMNCLYHFNFLKGIVAHQDL